MRKKVLLIINPKAGIKKKLDIEKAALQIIDSSRIDIEIVYTRYANHARELAQQAIDFDVIAAAGGDGTINEAASGMIGSGKTLAIIPCGSGNGLARHLGIPLKIEKAIELINHLYISEMDYIQCGNKYSFNVSGIGFDAEVAHAFAHIPGRGLKNYIKSVLNKYIQSKEKKYLLKIDDKKIETSAWLLAICNSNQFGNNAKIAPMADINDGLMQICILKRPPLALAPILAIQLFRGTIHQSAYTTFYDCKKLEVLDPLQHFIHIDGEPEIFDGPVTFEINGKINVLVEPPK